MVAVKVIVGLLLTNVCCNARYCVNVVLYEATFFRYTGRYRNGYFLGQLTRFTVMFFCPN